MLILSPQSILDKATGSIYFHGRFGTAGGQDFGKEQGAQGSTASLFWTTGSTGTRVVSGTKTAWAQIIGW